jgi:hypothetical protein
MRTFINAVLCAALACAAAVPVRADGGDFRKDDRQPRARAVKVRPRAPKPMPVTPKTHLKPAGDYRPPAVRYDIKPAHPAVHPVKTVVVRAPAHSLVGALAGFAAAVLTHETEEVVVGRTYWHTENSVRYAHMYDGHVHWYGFYDGPRFYWTRYEDGRWWWFDQTANRWLYWYDNCWWWHNPANPAMPYVVINDIYYPYTAIEANPQLAPGVTSAPGPATASSGQPPVPASAIAQPAAATAPAAAAQADASAAMTSLDAAGNRKYVSPDGTREVQIYGERHEAFLYDNTVPSDPAYISFLAQGVKSVHFSESGNTNLQILLLLSDGSYDVFDAAGQSLLQPASTAAAAPAQAAPASDTATPPASAPPIPAQ